QSFSFTIFNWLDVTHPDYGGESVLVKDFFFKRSSHPKTPQQEHPESLTKYTTQQPTSTDTQNLPSHVLDQLSLENEKR
ncbi:hypothetical protein Q6316_28765, partial [Klebsiella pneumoniae]|uniref:hypothetical protein n=1 Tax=Klebsiella pneumoniae TaxID=573 RepID=UPI002731311F